jgi:hypothetical protein
MSRLGGGEEEEEKGWHKHRNLWTLQNSQWRVVRLLRPRQVLSKLLGALLGTVYTTELSILLGRLNCE